MTDQRTRQVAEHYSAQAEEFAVHWAPVLRDISVGLFSALPLEHAGIVADIGSGTAGLIPSLRQHAPGALVVGVDLAEGMLRVAQRQIGGRFAAMDAQALGLRSATVDVAVVAFVLHRLAQPSQALAEALRVLRPGGAIGTVTWGRGDPAPAARIWAEELERHGARPVPVPIDHHSLVDEPEKVRRLLVEAGLEPVRVWTQQFTQTASMDGWLDAQVDRHSRARLARLDPEAREACVARARQQLSRLDAEAFRSRSLAVFAVARKMGMRGTALAC